MKLKWLPVVLAVCAFSCKKYEQQPIISSANPHSPVADSVALNVTIDDSRPGHTVSYMFEGLSYETALLAQNPEYLNSQNQVFINMIKNLGRGVLRIGGNSSDLMNWAGNTADTARNIVTTAQIDRLADFSKASGWPVIFGLNLANRDANAAAREASYVSKKLGHNLLAFQNGNEPDVYGLGPRPKSYSYSKFCIEWHNYFQSVRNLAPGVNFAGPDVTPFNNVWLRDFSIQENQNISMIDGHYYATGPASNPGIRYNDILNDNKNLYDYLATLNEVSQYTKKPFRISECNSVFGQGKPGVSNVFASALWALDFMWKVADNGGQGVNFHGGNMSFVYSPIAHPDGRFVAQPEYYAMLAFKYGAIGQTIIPAEMDNHGYNISAYAVINHKKGYSVTLINKEIGTSAIFTINFKRSIENVSVARLSSPSITSGDGISFAGSQVNTDGAFRPVIKEKYQANSSTITVKIPASSAAVVVVD